MSWSADFIQAALFTIPGAPQLDAAELWSVIAGANAPDAYQRPTASPAAGSFAHGVIGSLRVVIQSNLGRVDLFVQAEQQPDQDQAAEPARIQDFTTASEILKDATTKLLEKVRVVRVAAVANLSEIVSSESESSKRLSEICGVWFPDPPLDCIYQLNVRRPFAFATHLQMNRVVTWSAGNFQYVNMNVNFMTTGFLSSAKSIPIISMKVDVNSATNHEIGAEAASLFDELRLEVLQIAARGIACLHE